TGDDFSCALLDDGTVQCWGENDAGQTGFGDTSTSQPLPRAVAFAPGAVATSVVAGAKHACALLNNGDIELWGYNADGEIGREVMGNRSTPTTPLRFEVPTLAISAGAWHTCALLSNS